MSFWKFWEPEETVGEAWHEAVRDWDAEPRFSDAGVDYDSVKTSVGILFRSLGGPVGAEIMPYAATVSRHRLSLKRRMAHDVDHVTQASYDGARLAMPATIALFADSELARGLYLWLGALAAVVETPFAAPDDPLQSDIAMLRAVHRAEGALLERLPGYRSLRARLAEALVASRKTPHLPAQEAELEQAIRALLAQAPAGADDNATLRAIRDETADLSGFVADREYRPFRPVAMWPMLSAPRAPEGGGFGEDNSDPANNSSEGSEKTLKGKRRAADQAERRDSLILYRFESILSWAEFLNINRKVEDDEEDNAKKAAEDLDEISLVKNSKSAKTKLKFHLDLAPRDVDMSRLIGEHVYPEWDWKSGSYLADHVSVQEKLAEEADDSALDKPRARRRIARVRRQFEALRPRRRIVRRQADGFDLDLDEVIRARCDFLASGEGSDRLYSAIRDDERDLAVSVLIDTSRSTESAVSGRPVIEIAREALTALVGGIDACGDAVSVHAFSSLRRERVMVELVKDFDEENSPVIRRRIMGLTPKFYTRLGAAIRHVSRHLATRSAQRRLLLVITDGKPNDLDHYEGRHGVEDTRRAVIEARRLGQAVFAVTVDARAQDYIPHLFGQNGFAIVPDAEKLVEALPEMYRHVVA